MDLLICTIEGQRYGFSLTNINRIIPAVAVTFLPDNINSLLGAINVHGQITSVVDMRKLLGLPEKALALSDRFILCNIDKKQVALWVDSVHRIDEFHENELLAAEEISLNQKAIPYFLQQQGEIVFYCDIEKLLKNELA